MRIIDRATYRKIEHFLYGYHRIKEEIEKERAEIIERGAAQVDVSGKGRSQHSDPTAIKGIKLADNPVLAEKENWVKVIDKTIHNLKGTEKGNLLNLQYFENLGRYKICQRLHIERRTYFSWRNDIVYYVALLAQKYNLIDVEKVQH